MKLTIKSLGHLDSDDYGQILLTVENNEFKGTARFWAYSDVFEDFADKLSCFPFESKEPVVFEADDVEIEVSLIDSLGTINMKFTLNDYDENSLVVNEQSAETEALHKFARGLQIMDTSVESELILET